MLETKELNLLGELNDEQAVLEDFISENAGSSSYICDAISEAADSAIPIANYEIWKYASDISEYIEDAISEGLAPVDPSNVDLIKIFQAGYYQYYNQALYTNLDIMVYNYMVEQVNEYLDQMDEDILDELDMAEIEERLEDEADNFDNNNMFDFIDEIIESVKEMIDEMIEELEEEDEE
jgi:hypothetical protein